ncbi:MAG: hypothetical protein P9M06_07040 [Candidatus Saelkia tenebricola]|nr:hypothetical protein [Candidatus Saelkia tenebricola]
MFKIRGQINIKRIRFVLILIVIFTICLFSSNQADARRSKGAVDLTIAAEEIADLFQLDSDKSLQYAQELLQGATGDVVLFNEYLTLVKQLGEVISTIDNPRSTNVDSIVSDIVRLLSSLSDIQGGFESLMDMVIKVAERTRNDKYLFKILRCLDVAINDNSWLDSLKSKDHFSFCVQKIVQLVSDSDLSADNILPQLQFFLNSAKGDVDECNKLVGDFIMDCRARMLEQEGYYASLENLSSFRNVGVVSFDWGGVLSMVVDHSDIRDNVRNLLIQLQKSGIKCCIVTEAGFSEVSEQLRRLDENEKEGFSWGRCFENEIYQAVSPEISPTYTKGAYLQNMTLLNPGKLIVHFDDSPKYMQLNFIADSIRVLGVVAYRPSNSAFEDKIVDLSGADALVLDLGVNYNELLRLLGVIEI